MQLGSTILLCVRTKLSIKTQYQRNYVLSLMARTLHLLSYKTASATKSLSARHSRKTRSLPVWHVSPPRLQYEKCLLTMDRRGLEQARQYRASSNTQNLSIRKLACTAIHNLTRNKSRNGWSDSPLS